MITESHLRISKHTTLWRKCSFYLFSFASLRCEVFLKQLRILCLSEFASGTKNVLGELQPSNEKKVTFMDPSEGTSVSRQVVPGVLLMPDRNQGLNQVSALFLYLAVDKAAKHLFHIGHRL